MRQGLAQKLTAEIAHGIPYREPTHGYDGDEYPQHIHIVHAYGIGVDDERALALAQTHQSVLLL